MGLYRSLAGSMRLEVISADIPGMFTQYNRMNVHVFHVEQIDALTVRFSIHQYDYRTVIKIADQRGEKIRMIQKIGLYWVIRSAINRPVLLIGFFAFLLTALYLPSRVFFVRVEGNVSVPAKLIMECAKDCGIRFGASRREVRSEKMKNALLSQLPQLQWAGVNTSGCVATISVREKSLAEEENEKGCKVSSIIASRDGIIRECTVFQGNALCRVGEAVKKGQTLVSGYTDCGLTIKAEQANAEILAQTLHKISVVTPTDAAARGIQIDKKTHYSLLIGKKLIKFCKDSGISDSSCVKMYEEKYLTLPGGFRLPVGLVRETLLYYSVQDAAVTEAVDYSWLSSTAENYLKSQMVAGQILNEAVEFHLQEDTCTLSGQYACLEMIGQVKNEENLQHNAEDN